MIIPNPLTNLSNFAKGVLLVGALIISLIILWAAFLGGWNKIGNAFFKHQINAKQEEVQKELDQAAKDKQALQQTLLELKQAKDDYAKLKDQTDAAQKIFFDQAKSSAEKVAEYKQTLAAAPTHTSTDNITTDDLCARAKASNAGTDIISALCNQ